MSESVTTGVLAQVEPFTKFGATSSFHHMITHVRISVYGSAGDDTEEKKKSAQLSRTLLQQSNARHLTAPFHYFKTSRQAGWQCGLSLSRARSPCARAAGDDHEATTATPSSVSRRSCPRRRLHLGTTAEAAASLAMAVLDSGLASCAAERGLSHVKSPV